MKTTESQSSYILRMFLLQQSGDYELDSAENFELFVNGVFYIFNNRLSR